MTALNLMFFNLVSIHAPVKGRRLEGAHIAFEGLVSIHAPVKGRPRTSM